MTVVTLPDAGPMPPGPWTAEEWGVRCELAAACRLVRQFGWDDLACTHLSARVPGSEDRILVNPCDLMFGEVTAGSLLTIDAAGQAGDGDGRVSPAALTIHAALYPTRSEAGAVLHLHGRAGSIVAALEEGLLPLHEINMQFYNRLAYHFYGGLALDAEEQEKLSADLGERSAMILRNHGLLTVGRSVPEAFMRMYYLEESCRIQVSAFSTGRPLVVPNAEICERTASQREEERPEAGRREWAALLRLLDQSGAAYAS